MTKEILESYQQMKHEARIIYQIWRKLEQEKLSFNSSADDMPKTSNRRTLSDIMAESDARAQEYYNLHLMSLQTLAKIERFINSLADPLHRNILRLKYIEGYQWWKVARELDYSSERYLRDMRDRILAGGEDDQTNKGA